MSHRLNQAASVVLCFSLWGLFFAAAARPVFSGEEVQRYDLAAANGFATVSPEQIDAAVSAMAPDARLFYTPQRIALAKAKIDGDPIWGAYYSALENHANALLDVPPLERIQEGRRLLPVSREALRRIFTLTFCAEIHPEKTAYAERALAEMRVIAQFSDWNPSHFLDVGEMTAAMAIGYDALRRQMSEEDQNLIVGAIVAKGLRSTDTKEHLWWIANTANWNQVCHAGLTLGALAVADRQGELARKVIRRAVNGITYSMSSYEPDGNYTEGATYWMYGTSFNILLLTALKDTLGTDFGRSDAPGFSKTIHYYEQVFGPSGKTWNYSDSEEGAMYEPTVFFFAEKLKDKTITYNEYRLLAGLFNRTPPEKKGTVFGPFAGARLAPMALLFDTGTIQDPPISPKENGFVGIGNGKAPVAVFRTGWEPDAAWFGMKGGTPSAPHAHMDAGSFVYERYGFRWSVELGAELYHKIESLGMSLWSIAQDSDRWKIYRYSNFSHSTLTVNNELMRVGANAPILEASVGRPGEDSYVVFDLTPVYGGCLRNAQRKGTLHGDGTLEITDTLTAPDDKNASGIWRMITRAVPEALSDTEVRLSMGEGESKASITLEARLEGTDQPVRWEWPEAKTQNPWDEPNPGAVDLHFSFEVPAGETVTVRVDLR